MNSGSIDGVNRLDSGQDVGDQGTGQFMNEGTEAGVFLGGAAHRGKGPDGVGAVKNGIDLHQGEIVGQTVIAQMIPKGPFKLFLVGINGAANDKIGLGRHRQIAWSRHQGNTMPAQQPGKGQLGHTFGQGHDRRNRECRGPPDKNMNGQGSPQGEGLAVMHADTAMNLVVQPHLFIGQVLVTGQLNPVHPQIRMAYSRVLRVFTVNLRQGDEGTAIIGPAFDLRQQAQAGLLQQNRATAHFFGEQMPGGRGGTQQIKRVSQQLRRINFQTHQSFHLTQAVAKQKAGTLQSPKKVGHRRKLTIDQVGKKQGRPLGLIHPALNGACQQIGFDGLVNANQLGRFFQIVDCRFQGAISH